jgi:hypothetical protein
MKANRFSVAAAACMAHCIFAFSAIAATPPPKPDPEVDLKKQISVEWYRLADYCLTRKLNAEAKTHCDDSLKLDPDNAAAKTLLLKCSGDSSADDQTKQTYVRQLDASKKAIARLYLRFLDMKPIQQNLDKSDGYLLTAFALDPSAAGGRLRLDWQTAMRKPDWKRAYALLAAAEKVQSDPERAKALKTVEYKAAEATPIHRKAKNHPMVFNVVLPKGWTPGKKYPVLMACEGAGCNWQGMIYAYLGERDRLNLPFIIAAPWTVTNTNGVVKNDKRWPYTDDDWKLIMQSFPKFDVDGILAVMEELKEEFGAEDRFYMVGFSGGGNPLWATTLAHPDRVVAASPCCGNFFYTVGISNSPDKGVVVIKGFQGDKDEYKEKMLDGQWKAAEALCKANGFTNITREIAVGEGHSGCGKLVMAFMAERFKAEQVRAAEEKKKKDEEERKKKDAPK